MCDYYTSFIISGLVTNLANQSAHMFGSKRLLSLRGKKVKIIIKDIQEAGLEPEITPSTRGVEGLGVSKEGEEGRRRRGGREKGKRAVKAGGVGGGGWDS